MIEKTTGLTYEVTGSAKHVSLTYENAAGGTSQRGSSLPFILVLLGVTGGVLAFGFVGLFIGPALLAVALGLFHNWSTRPDQS